MLGVAKSVAAAGADTLVVPEGPMSNDTSKSEYLLVDDLAAVDSDPALGGTPALLTAYAVLRQVRRGQTRAGKPFVELKLADRSRTVAAKIWSDWPRAMQAATELSRGTHVKVLFERDQYQGALQLNVRGLRAVRDDDMGYDKTRLVDEAYALIEDLICDTLVFDIETVPAVDLRKAPPTIAQAVTKYADRQEWDQSKVMSLSPWFGKVVSLAVGDGEAQDPVVTVLVVPPDGAVLGEMPSWIRPVSEADLLRAFWALAGEAECVVSYNGRGFDVPFLIGRSLIRDVPVRVDLMTAPYSLRPHLDLFNILGGRGRGPSSLDVICWSLGLTSPKEEMDGSMVAVEYEKGELAKIAEYNAGDVRATSRVYQRVRDQVLRWRDDW